MIRQSLAARGPARLLTLAFLLLPFLATPGCQTVTDLISPPQRSVCKRTATLCGGFKEEQQSRCEAQIVELKLDPQRLRDLSTCVDKASNCAEAAGCAAGVGLNSAMESAKDFLKGMQRAMEKP